MHQRAVWLVTAVLLAGCSGNSSGWGPGNASTSALAASPLSAASRLAYAPPRVPSGSGIVPPVINTAQFYHDNLAIYGESPGDAPQVKKITLTFLESITSGIDEPLGSVAAPNDDWYIANSGGNNVLELAYESSAFVPVATYTDGVSEPTDVAVTSKGEVAIANIDDVEVFAPKSTRPLRTLMAPNVLEGFGIAFDKAGNCYWSVETTSSSSQIVMFPKCEGKAVSVLALGAPGGLTFDKSNNLYYIDTESHQVFKCAGTSSCAPFGPTFAGPYFLHFDAKWKHLWVADTGASIIYGLDPKSAKVISMTNAEGGPSDPPFGIAPLPGAAY